MTVAKTKKYYALIILAMLCVAIPSFNLIDLLPDCLLYFLLAAMVGSAGSSVPYLSETRDALTKLGFIALARIPGMVLMYSNMFSGRDIMALFTFSFGALELIFIIGALKNGFDALFYLGSRSEAGALIAPFKFLGIKIRPEGVRNMSIAFFIARAILNTLPQFFLLTASDEWMTFTLRRIYPYVELVSLGMSLLFGLLWFALTVTYLLRIRKEGKVYSSVVEVAGKEALDVVAKRKKTKKLLSTLMLLAAASILSVDVKLEEYKNINVLPHFIWGLLLLFIAWRLFEDRRTRLLSAISSGLYILFGLLAHSATVSFVTNFDPDSFAYDRGSAVYKSAIEGYLPVEIFTVLECLAFLAFMVVMAVAFARLIREHTGLSPDSEKYSKQDRQRHFSLSLRGYLLFGFSGLITVCKTLNVFFATVCEKIFVSTGADTLAVIAEPMLPWFGVFTFMLSVGLTVYAFLYLADVRADVKMKYEDEMDW